MGHCECHTNWDCGARTIGLPPMVRAYWWTDCGQRVGGYLDPGPYTLTNAIRKREGVEMREVSRGGKTWWIPTETLKRVAELQGVTL